MMISKVKIRLFLILFLSGMLGVVSLLLVDLAAIVALMPAPTDGSEIPRLTPALKLLTMIQPAVILIIAVVIGIAVSPRVGLSAPAAEALASGGKILAALRAQVRPGLLGGLLGAVCIVLTAAVSKLFLLPETVERIHNFQALVPFPTRLLYGGITEEVLIRWGLMSFLVWIGWRVLQKGVGKPARMHFVSAILISAFVFGVGHLPVAVFVLKETTIATILFVIVANSAFGIIAGYLY